MGAFFAKHQYLVIWISALVIIGAIAILIVQLNGVSLPTIASLSQPTPAPGISAPPAPPAPSVTLTVEQNGKKNSLLVQWQNLPANTTALDIFRAAKNNTSSWQLWKTIQLSADKLFGGNATIDLGSSDESGYVFYVQAVNNGGGGSGGGGNSSSTQVLWTSGTGGASTSTNGTRGGRNNGGGGGNSSSTSGSGNNTSSTTSNSSSTTGNNSGNNSSSTSGNGTNSSGTNGNPYYNPQIQVTGYGTAPGDFWVSHANQNIEMGWQNLPAGTDSISVTRTQDQTNGPWNQILKEQNPSLTGSYSLELVDGTINDPYYYELTAFSGTTVIGTYGPVYLPPAQ